MSSSRKWWELHSYRRCDLEGGFQSRTKDMRNAILGLCIAMYKTELTDDGFMDVLRKTNVKDVFARWLVAASFRNREAHLGGSKKGPPG